MSYIIYLLYNTCNNSTYVGITNNKERRLRQHNGELVGGARYTKLRKGTGKWNYYGWLEIIEGEEEIIINRILSLEKKIKILSRKSKCKLPLEKRLDAINIMLIQNPDLMFKKYLN